MRSHRPDQPTIHWLPVCLDFSEIGLRGIKTERSSMAHSSKDAQAEGSDWRYGHRSRPCSPDDFGRTTKEKASRYGNCSGRITKRRSGAKNFHRNRRCIQAWGCRQLSIDLDIHTAARGARMARSLACRNSRHASGRAAMVDLDNAVRLPGGSILL